VRDRERLRYDLSEHHYRAQELEFWGFLRWGDPGMRTARECKRRRQIRALAKLYPRMFVRLKKNDLWSNDWSYTG
jgi:hypothetical protein